MRFKSFKISKSNNKPEEDTAESGDNTATQVVGMEEKINKRTKNLKETAQQLKGLSGTSKDSEEDNDAPPKPHGPLGELTVEPDDKLLDLEAEADISSLLEENDEEVTVIEVNTGVVLPVEADELSAEAAATAEADEASAQASAPIEVEEAITKASVPADTDKASAEATVTAEAENEPKPEDDSDSFNSLFSDEEEEANPLANLINSLPDVTAQELFDELKEIKEIILERQKS